MEEDSFTLYSNSDEENERNNNYIIISKDIGNLLEMFKTLNDLTISDQYSINLIENNIIDTKNMLENTVPELKKAEKYKNTYRYNLFKFNSSVACGVGMGIGIGVAKSSLTLGVLSGCCGMIIPIVIIKTGYMLLH